MSRGKGKAGQRKREKFKKLHPEGRKQFAKDKRRRKIEKRRAKRSRKKAQKML